MMSRAGVGPPPLARGTRRPRRRGVADARTTPARAGNTSDRVRLRGSGRDHPRSRGEHSWAVASIRRSRGPPPLARGTHRRSGVQVDADRTTPARAGNTSCPTTAVRRCTDHPRSRGEHSRPVWSMRHGPGPPPLARGTHGQGMGSEHVVRTTPARAGNTGCGARILRAGKDHPRSRGEHTLAELHVIVVRGPPPLARGTRPPLYRRLLALRTTPARAGNTRSTTTPSSSTTDHPRSRGEHPFQRGWSLVGSGPPPLARGTHNPGHWLRRDWRTTPARAGNTPSCSVRWCASSDHPRSRGEHAGRGRERGAHRGPPPLARGTRRRGQPPCGRARTTPARAGNTRRGRPGGWCRADHPRSRGEHASSERARSSSAGPPPLARGTHPPFDGVDRGRRTTPARAGNTRAPSPADRSPSDHPRSRGEHAANSLAARSRAGPPPLARGTRRLLHVRESGARTTPARAGNTTTGDPDSSRSADHPRSRGEHPRPGDPDGPHIGPPPLARGTPGG